MKFSSSAAHFFKNRTVFQLNVFSDVINSVIEIGIGKSFHLDCDERVAKTNQELLEGKIQWRLATEDYDGTKKIVLKFPAKR